jgi:hypothetical protein
MSSPNIIRPFKPLVIEKMLLLLLTAFVVSCSTGGTPVVVKTQAPVPPSSNPPTMPPVSPTARGTSTDSLPTSLAHAGWNFKSAYVTFKNNYTLTELWVIEPPYQTPRLILSPESSNALQGYIVAWSHDGKKIAYIHLKDANTLTVSVIDISSLEQKQLAFSSPVEPLGPGSSLQVYIYPGSWSLKDNWLHISVLYTRPNKTDFGKEIILGTTNNQMIELDKNVNFSAWSPVIVDQFLYTPDLDSDAQTLSVGEVGHVEPVTTISKPKTYAVSPGAGGIAWSPDGIKAILQFYDTADAQDRIALVDLQQATWTTLPPRGLYIPSSWSPNNQWVALYNRDLFFWSADKPKEDLIRIKAIGDFIDPKAWIPDGSMFVYQDGNTLYAVNPVMPSETIEVLDLSTLKVQSDDPLTTLNIWMPPPT